MPRLRCPRCSSVVEVAAGAAPTCSACGFGTRPPAVAPAAPPGTMAVPPIAAQPVPASPPTPAPPPQPSFAPPPPAPSRRGAVIAICVVGVLVLAGAAAAVAYFALRGDGATALTEEEARQRVAASLQAAGSAFTGEATDDELRKVTIEADQGGSPSGPDDLFGGLGDLTMTVEYGKDDRVKFDLHMSSGAVTVAFTMICTPDRQYMVVGEQTYASRPMVAPPSTEGGDDETPCRDLDSTGFNESVPPLQELESEDADITRNDDGSITAVIDDAEDGRFVLEIDAKGHVRTVTATMEEDGDERTMVMTYDYGERTTVPIPTDFQLLPATVALGPSWEGSTQTWTVLESPEEPPLGDFEARVRDFSLAYAYDEETGDFTESDGLVALFDLDDGRTQTDGNLSFEFTDADGDGKLSAGDSYSLTDLSQAEETAEPDGSSFDSSSSSYEVILYDKVADGEVNSGFSEAPSPAWLVLAALAIAGLSVRRR